MAMGTSPKAAHGVPHLCALPLTHEPVTPGAPFPFTLLRPAPSSRVTEDTSRPGLFLSPTAWDAHLSHLAILQKVLVNCSALNDDLK